MEIKRADRTQRYGIKDNSDLSQSVKASQATANMYDQLTNSFLQLSDMATTNAINGEIRDAKVEGQTKGIEASAIDKEGAIKGYDKESEVFKWDVASNEATKTSFEANVKARASSSMKTLSKEVYGNKEAYQTVAKQLANDATANMTDEHQRKFTINSYAKSYNQNMGTVSTQYHKTQGKMAKEGWNEGRVTFEEDYGVILSSMAVQQDKLNQATIDGDAGAMKHYMDAIEKKQTELANFKKARMKSGGGAVKLGAVSTEQIEANTHADIVKAISTSITQRYYDADTSEEKGAIRKEIDQMPENKSASEETLYMSPKSKRELIDALDTEELREQKMWKSEQTRIDKEYEINKEGAVIEIQTNLIMDEETAITNIEDAYKAGYISPSQRKTYLDHAMNGSDVLRDTWSVYTDVTSNIEDYSIERIASEGGLTDATKKKLIADRMKWEEEGNEWMTAPDYKEGKEIIRNAYRFPESSILPDFINQDDKKRYAEMQNLIQQYRDSKRASVSKEIRGDGVTIAEELLKNKKEDITSKLRNVYVEDKTVTKDIMSKEVQATGKTVTEIMKTQTEKVPESTASPELQKDIDNPPEKTTTEEGFFPWSDDTEVDNPEYKAWQKRMGISDEEAETIKKEVKEMSPQLKEMLSARVIHR